MVRILGCSSLLIALAGLSGCGLGSGSPDVVKTTTPAAAVKATGSVHGGQQPVTGSTIQLWAVGTSGFGSAATSLLGTVTTSDGTSVVNSNANAGNANNTLPAGSFTITGAFTCPTASTLVYLTATGGNPGLSGTVNNSAIVMMTPLGQCGNLNSSTYVVLNELTTATTAEVLSTFMSANGSIGSPSDATSLQAIANAFAAFNTIASISTGTAPSGFPKLDTIANALVPCVNTSAPTSSDCSTLFADTTPSGGSAPTTVLGAVLNIVLNPTMNTTAIFNLSTANAPFQPAFTSAPGLWNIITNGAAKNTCGSSNGGDIVTGTITYSGTKTGRVYIAANNTLGCDQGTQGTSILVSGAGSYNYTIHGVPISAGGSQCYLTAFMDTQGYGFTNAANPTGTSTNFGIGSPTVTAPTFALTDPATVTLTSAPSIVSAGGTNNGAILLFNPIKTNGVEVPTSYTLEWSTSASMTPIVGTKTFPAAGKHSNVWFLNGLTDGSVYYFAAYGTSAGTAVGPLSGVYGPVTIGAPSAGSNVSGNVSYTGTATGPMYTGLYNQDSSTLAPYVQYISNPVSAQPFNVNVPNSASAVYVPVALIDQNNNGVADAGDITNFEFQGGPISVTGTTTNQNLTLPTGNAQARVITLHFLSGGTQTYALFFWVNLGAKLPATVTLLNSYNPDGANIDNGPLDIANCAETSATCSGGDKDFQIYFNLNTTAPTTGDTYPIHVTYTDGTSETLIAEVTNVLGAFATNLAPQTTGSGNTTPTFTWTASTCSTCTYSLLVDVGTGGRVWYVPNSGNGLPPGTNSVTWAVDPTDPTNLPNPGSLSTGTTYSWSVTVQDSNYNQATSTVSYQP